MNFTGDLTKLIECSTEAVKLIRGGDYTSRTLHDHLACAYGEANALRPDPSDDDDKPVFGSVAFTVEDCAYRLEDELPEIQDGKVVAQGPADWLRIFQLVTQLIELLKK